MKTISKPFALGFPWQTRDPFLFCVYHQDFYPKGKTDLSPDASLAGRSLGQDFTLKDGWRMYHGLRIPGFPGHPHRGFETVTVVQEGWVDHADSLGAAGRYGAGDTQWMTAGKGVQHSEMFPLLNQNQENTLELFQIWLNLPRASKMAPPHFQMIWSEQKPIWQTQDANGKKIQVEIIAGSLEGLSPPAPPPDSWAADPSHSVAIWVIKLEAGAQWHLPVAETGLNRTLYYYQGESLKIGGETLQPGYGIDLPSDQSLGLENSEQESRLLLLQGKPLKEPVVQYGPFVMNTQAEIQMAFLDYQKDQFGGWPWPDSDPIHGKEKGRFARYFDGQIEEP
ncbi:pirin [bacterium (Candidatus Blackallbacteria) CG17_big_fil_post_rev_8_21_14_2_50_48_46]|uniref:Pirin n=1 Tax=bacterium (Candidatus Blackallbacteria) CG17_big_fil_post_rev_8_21_14_2_50_48_46 TaxID=2014261 RepID=A0A2M7G3Y6_9BACT|nr:MAG: pirin [bacterium (Candidatus Blackallbacteria) CG18_big_fil_WC_8_21_14_2_50_49_26]PIW16596.1 MAG: pirin [bacterium (Candidatus Blackallbacteria) CG17_big_fil_post_rev_8_21_14_2_50_48_46]PIW46104.1 MAG: pirin [bacterium (Candidatus Blackallbacteria) CG13_big_fil_rev_8_21_14_2_50_49_14]